jgi:hypothetical protein
MSRQIIKYTSNTEQDFTIIPLKFIFTNQRPPVAPGPFQGPSSYPPALLVVADFDGRFICKG